MNKSIYSLIRLVAVFFLFSCAKEERYAVTEKAVFEVKQVPIIQGAVNLVGELRIDGEIAGEFNQMQASFVSDTPLDQVVLVEQDGSEFTIVHAANHVQGPVVFPIPASDTSKDRVFIFHIIPSQQASLLEKVRLTIDYLQWGRERGLPSGVGDVFKLRLARGLRNRGDDGVHSFRIPGLATSKNGTLLAVYDMRWERSNDLQGHVDVGLSRSTDGGSTWEPMRTIIDMGEWGGLPQDQNGVGDPAILVDDQTGTIWVAALWMHGKPAEAAWNSSQPGMRPDQTGQLVLVKSEDDGITWSDPINVTESLKDPSWYLFLAGPGRGITTRDGTLVFAGQYKDADQVPHSTIIYSIDRGATWRMGKGARTHTTEAQVVELSDGSLMLNMRDDRGGARAIMVTRDLGETWEEHASHRTALVEPICMASIIANPYTDDAPVFLFSNPNTTDGRYNITIKTSFDEGNSWPETNQVLLDEGVGWGYTCLTMVDERHVGILYESSQAHMTFQIIPIEELIP
ncbi:Sialidase [Lunatimonas lonarensis]|uniref:exo-alpha-sialidase n=1 Tax=Lunatimonas lonarensis TaxID=1232681 RepID=R7ZY12_9BACT|nr:sialidase family protein [Lunatimonas lonarensis]EON79041.1 Sialidase [Lunatimonas lonarensis]